MTFFADARADHPDTSLEPDPPIPTLVQVVEVPVLTEQVVLAPLAASAAATGDAQSVMQQQMAASVWPRIDALLQAEIQRAMGRVLEQQTQSLASLQALLPALSESLRQDCADAVHQWTQQIVAEAPASEE